MKPLSPRRARGYVLLHAEDCDPPHGLDLTPGSRDSIKVETLEIAFRLNGFDKTKAALVGYPLDGRIQLATGTHRHEAARRTGIPLPVTLHLRSDVEAAWGTPKWAELIADIAVGKLESVLVGDPVPPPGLNERVDLSRDIYREENEVHSSATSLMLAKALTFNAKDLGTMSQLSGEAMGKIETLPTASSKETTVPLERQSVETQIAAIRAEYAALYPDGDEGALELRLRLIGALGQATTLHEECIDMRAKLRKYPENQAAVGEVFVRCKVMEVDNEDGTAYVYIDPFDGCGVGAKEWVKQSDLRTNVPQLESNQEKK